MKVIVLLLLSFSILASGTKEATVSTVKVKEIENQLAEHPKIKECQAIKDPTKRDSCVEERVSELSEDDLKTISKDIGLNAYEFEAGKESQAVRDFMRARIKNIVQGDNKASEKVSYDEEKALNLKDMKVVDHNNYHKIYKAQLGNNMILDINSYCLETFGFEGGSKKIVRKYAYDSDKGKKDKNGFPTLQQVFLVNVDDVDNIGPAVNAKSLWAKIREYSKKKNAANERSLKDIKEIKTKLLDDKKMVEVAKASQGFCQTFGIEAACNIYKCNTGYDSMSKKQKALCDHMGFSKEKKDDTGKVACTLVSRLEEYKKTFAAIDEQEQVLNEEANKPSLGYSIKDKVADRLDSDDVMEFATLSSKDLSGGVDEIKDSAQMAKELDENCKAKGFDADECKGSVATLSEEDIKKIELEKTIAKKVYEEKLNKLAKNNDPKEFEEFLKKHGLFEKYGKDLENADLGEIRKTIANDYASKQDALVETMKEKYKSLSAKKVVNKAVATEDVSQKVDELKEQKDYIETMYQFNNFVSSFMQIEGADKQRRGFNFGKDKELEALKSDSEAAQEYEKYSQLFNDPNAQKRSNDESLQYTTIIDLVIGGE